MPPGHENTASVEVLIGSLLQVGPVVGGNLQDQSLGRTDAKAPADRLGPLAEQADSDGRWAQSAAKCVPLVQQVGEASEAEEVTKLRALVTDLAALEADTPQADTPHHHRCASLS